MSIGPNSSSFERKASVVGIGGDSQFFGAIEQDEKALGALKILFNGQGDYGNDCSVEFPFTTTSGWPPLMKS